LIDKRGIELNVQYEAKAIKKDEENLYKTNYHQIILIILFIAFGIA
jgi:hypothetical protein